MKIIDSLVSIVRCIVHHLLLVRDQVSDNRINAFFLIDICSELLPSGIRAAAAAKNVIEDQDQHERERQDPPVREK
jgi:hypothetical protein